MKSVRLIALSITAGVLCLGVAVAQESAGKKSTGKTGKKAPEKEMAMPMPKPSPEMQKLSQMLVGTWSTAETFEVSEMMPKGGKGAGTAVIKNGPGGLSVVEDYRSHGGMGAFSGHGVFWWDDKAQGYKSIWCDNATPNGCSVANGLGKWEGGNLVFNDEQEMMGKKQAMKETLVREGSAMTFTMESGDPGGAMKKVMTIKYKQAAPKAAAPASGGKGN